jgi:hypothetical protein
MTSYRVQYTEIKPGGSHAQQDVSVRGTLDDVRTEIDSHRVYGRDPITVTEFTASDSVGRIVPASEWDAADI